MFGLSTEFISNVATVKRFGADGSSVSPYCQRKLDSRIGFFIRANCISSDEGLALKMSALESLCGGQINPDTNSKDGHALHNSSLYPKREHDCEKKHYFSFQ